MSEPSPSNQRAALWARHCFRFATSVPIALTLALILILDSCSLPESSVCKLSLAARATHDGAPFSVVRTNGVLRLPIDQKDQIIGSGHLFVWDSADPCFWAPLSRTLRADILVNTFDGSPVTTA